MSKEQGQNRQAWINIADLGKGGQSIPVQNRWFLLFQCHFPQISIRACLWISGLKGNKLHISERSDTLLKYSNTFAGLNCQAFHWVCSFFLENILTNTCNLQKHRTVIGQRLTGCPAQSVISSSATIWRLIKYRSKRSSSTSNRSANLKLRCVFYS